MEQTTRPPNSCLREPRRWRSSPPVRPPRSSSLPASEITVSPAVHSQGPLLLLAVSGLTPGGRREAGGVGGMGGRAPERWEARTSQLLVREDSAGRQGDGVMGESRSSGLTNSRMFFCWPGVGWGGGGCRGGGVAAPTTVETKPLDKSGSDQSNPTTTRKLLFWKPKRGGLGSAHVRRRQSLPKVAFVLGTPLSYLHIYEK